MTLWKQGKRVQPKAIFIDGPDQCANGDAQAEIIEIIASSVRATRVKLQEIPQLIIIYGI